MNNNRYESFDGLRAIAALGIAMMHYLVNVSVSSPLKESSILYKDVIPFFTMFVYMFFILSAFSMCCGYYGKFVVLENNQSNFDTEKFYIKRYKRIWPFFAFLVCVDFLMKPSLSEFYQCFADLTLAFNLLPNPHIDAIGVGWFLGLIFLFYIIFPWFVFLIRTKKRAWFVLGISIVFHVILVRYFLTQEFCTDMQIADARHNIIYSFPFFVVGGLMYLYRDVLGQDKYKFYYLIAVFLLTFIQIGWQPLVFNENILFLLIVFCFWILYAMTGGVRFKGVSLLDNSVMHFLGGISMEIYLCHMVMFRLVEKIHMEKFITNSHLLYWSTCIVGIGFAILFSWIFKEYIYTFVSKKIFKENNR